MFGNMKEMMKQGRSMKSERTKVKKEWEKVEVQGSSSNGSCVITMTADMKTTKVTIDETLLSSDAYIIENAIKVAVNNALQEAKDTSAKRLKSVTGGLMDNLPGF